MVVVGGFTSFLTGFVSSVPAVLLPTVAAAAEKAEPLQSGSLPAGSEGETVVLLLAIVKVAASLIVVVGLMLLAVRLIKKIGIGQGNTRDGRMIRVLDTRMIAPKKYVALVSIAGQCVALGITDQQINMLTKVEDFHPDESEDAAGGSGVTGGQPFSAALRKATGLLGKGKATKQQAKDKGESSREGGGRVTT